MIATLYRAIRWLAEKFTGAPLRLARNQPKTPNPPPPRNCWTCRRDRDGECLAVRGESPRSIYLSPTMMWIDSVPGGFEGHGAPHMPDPKVDGCPGYEGTP